MNAMDDYCRVLTEARSALFEAIVSEFADQHLEPISNVNGYNAILWLFSKSKTFDKVFKEKMK